MGQTVADIINKSLSGNTTTSSEKVRFTSAAEQKAGHVNQHGGTTEGETCTCLVTC